MDVQVDYFNITRKQIDKLLGASKARDFLMKESIFSITIGANDFLNNYLLPVLSVGARITESPDAFVDDMISHLRDQLTVRKSYTNPLINLHSECIDLSLCIHIIYGLFNF